MGIGTGLGVGTVKRKAFKYANYACCGHKREVVRDYCLVHRPTHWSSMKYSVI